MNEQASVERKAITEEMGLHKQWAEDARKQTMETLPEFCRHLMEDYIHDYGTSARAVGACAVAAAWAANNEVGLTGFQAGFVNWEFLQHWGHIEPPARLTEYRDMLYPQHADKFTTINQATWDWLQEEARKSIAKKDDYVHPDVLAHWQSIAAGEMPFGYKLNSDG